MPPRYTPRSATRALRDVRPLVERIRATFLALEASPSPGRDGDQRVPWHRFALVLRWTALSRRLGRLGVRVEDGGRGRVCFPARRDGRDVWLCWALGEARVDRWRETRRTVETVPVDRPDAFEACESD